MWQGAAVTEKHLCSSQPQVTCSGNAAPCVRSCVWQEGRGEEMKGKEAELRFKGKPQPSSAALSCSSLSLLSALPALPCSLSLGGSGAAVVGGCGWRRARGGCFCTPTALCFARGMRTRGSQQPAPAALVSLGCLPCEGSAARLAGEPQGAAAWGEPSSSTTTTQSGLAEQGLCRAKG